MALLASPDVGIRGGALLENCAARRTSGSLNSAFLIPPFFHELILSNVVHVSCDATDPFGLRE